MSVAASKRPTLQDVANVAGVSLSTASLALRGHSRTSSQTQAAVRAAAEKLHYVPHSLGRGLRSQRTGAIALVIPRSSEHIAAHPYYLGLLTGIEERLNEVGLLLILSTSPAEQDSRTPYLRLLQGRAADGVIVASARMADRNVLQLAAAGYPAVFIGRYPHSVDVEAVGIDDLGGGRLATDHLIEVHSARRIAHITGPADSLSAADRMDGYRTALGRHSLVFEEALVVAADLDQASGEIACQRLLDSGASFDALFVCNDDSAVGAMRVLQRAGIRVPDDVRVVAFDDGLLAPVVVPALTTVRQPVRELGRQAASRLIELVERPDAPVQQTHLPVDLVIRSSCGCRSPA